MTKPCPCGSGDALAVCCGPYHSGAAAAPTAEALMRARYSAFCTGAVRYLIDTHHADFRSASECADLQKSFAGTEWTNLLILATDKGAASDTEGMVEFAAAFRSKTAAIHHTVPEAGQLHERSRFVREDGRWLYTDGDALPPYRTKPNAPCWCGSGRKTKRCHG